MNLDRLFTMLPSRPFIPFNVRNEMIDELKLDLPDIPLNRQFEVLKSFMPEKHIYNSVLKLNDVEKWIKDNPHQPMVRGGGGGSRRGYFVNFPGAFDDTSLKAYWKFNEASGDIINQSASAADLGSAADLQVTGMTYVPSGGTSPRGYEGSFDGINDSAVSGTSLSQYNFLHNTTALWTWAFWVKWTGSGTDSFFTSADNIFSADEIGFDAYFVDTNALRIIFGNGSGTAARTDFVTANNTIPNKTNWHFVCMTYDESLGSNNFNIKVNDANIQTFSKEFANSNSNATRAGTFATMNANGYFGGLLSEVSLWNKSMSAADQTTLYNGGSGLPIY